MTQQAHVGNQAVSRAEEMFDKLLERIRRELGVKVGYEQVSTRTVRAAYRKAKEGDFLSLAQLVSLARQQPEHVEGPCDCGLCAELLKVMDEEANDAES